MRIAYVTIHIAPELMQGGVGKKIRTQIDLWRKNGHEVGLFSLTPENIPFPGEHQSLFDKNSGLIKRELARAQALTKMISAIKEYHPDIIYLRYGLYSYPLHNIFKIAPVVLETNSNDMDEYNNRGLFFYWINRFTRGIIFGSVRGIVFPSHELSKIMLQDWDKPFCVISNGVNLENLKPMPAPQNPNPVLTLVGSPGMDWHGIDKLLALASIYPDLVVNIVGYSKNDINRPVTDNVHFHGFLHGDDLKKVLSTTDVACGTLALHRKNMNEASPLKVREALAYGIPVIIGYSDTDLDSLKFETILFISNTESNVTDNAEHIRQFAYDMMGKRAEMEKFAPYLDQKLREMARLNFFEKIVKDNKP